MMRDQVGFKEWLNDQNGIFVLDRSYSINDYLPIDLSVNNKDLLTVDMSDPLAVEEYIKSLLKVNEKQVAYGGYQEHRSLYDRSNHFGDSQEARNIHLGVDLWCDAGTAVLAALEGKVHSFQNNNNFGDYGPTIILEHDFGKEKFFSLYGHLSMDSITDIEEGQEVKKGEEIGRLGTSEVNGDYAPHLHFQLIHDLKGKWGDYPGVCSKKDVEKFSSNCPDPSGLLGLLL